MKKAKNLFYFLSIFMVASMFSCKGPAGEDGIDGIDGTDGQNGNANVTIISLAKANVTWTAGDYLGRTANTYSLTTTAVTQTILDHGTVLGFCYLSPDWYALPFSWMDNAGTLTQYIFHAYSLNTIKLFAYQTSGVLDPASISQYRFLLITDNTVMTKSTESSMSIIEKMTEAGVDVNDYHQVMNYFGLEE